MGGNLGNSRVLDAPAGFEAKGSMGPSVIGYTDGISVTFNVIDLGPPSFGGKNRSSKITSMGTPF